MGGIQVSIMGATPGTSISVSSQDIAPKMCAGRCAHTHPGTGTLELDIMHTYQYSYADMNMKKIVMEK